MVVSSLITLLFTPSDNAGDEVATFDLRTIKTFLNWWIDPAWYLKYIVAESEFPLIVTPQPI